MEEEFWGASAEQAAPVIETWKWYLLPKSLFSPKFA